VIVADRYFLWFVVAMTVGICVIWTARDTYMLMKHLPARGRAAWRDPAAWRDQIFGSIIGLILCAMGLIGVAKFYLGH
jgi:hypothetical protein